MSDRLTAPSAHRRSDPRRHRPPVREPGPRYRSGRDEQGRDRAAPAGPGRSRGRRPPTLRSGGAWPWIRRRWRLAVLLFIFVVAAPMWISLSSALTDPALGPTLPARFAEWARDHGAGAIVTWAENEWYALHKPPPGGKPPPGAIPAPTPSTVVSPSTGSTVVSPSTGSTVGGKGGGRHKVPLPAHLPTPPTIPTIDTPALPGEGQWHPIGRTVGGIPVAYRAVIRADTYATSLVADVAWLDTKMLAATLYSGSYVPGGGPWKDSAPVGPAAARTLEAAFNGGFRLADSEGGYYSEDKTVAPLVAGRASFVVYRDGNVAIGAWGRDLGMSSQVSSVFQNLDLLVDGGKPVPGLLANDNAQWGFTLGGGAYVARSGVGITADGALVYVAGPRLTITDLAAVLAHAGAVRAMELDINPAWVNLAYYTPSSAGGAAAPYNGTTLYPDMTGDAYRYFEEGWARSFVTMSVRAGR